MSKFSPHKKKKEKKRNGFKLLHIQVTYISNSVTCSINFYDLFIDKKSRWWKVSVWFSWAFNFPSYQNTQVVEATPPSRHLLSCSLISVMSFTCALKDGIHPIKTPCTEFPTIRLGDYLYRNVVWRFEYCTLQIFTSL